MKCEENQKKEFWQEINEVMQEISENENIMIWNDMNGYMGNDEIDYDKVHEGLGIE